VLIPLNARESAFSENFNGKYIFVPDEFKSATDKSTSYETLMFLSKEIEVGDYLYFDSKSIKPKQGTDIYRVKRLKNEEYSIPELLPLAINTPYDEAYPYFNKKSSTLYFSSKGLNTSGGYDIFYSRLDTVSQTWSTAERLEFPINTPFDDFLYTISADEKNATFMSNRNCASKAVSAYTLVIQPIGEYVSLWNKDEILAAAKLLPGEINHTELTVPDVVSEVPVVAEKHEMHNIPEISVPEEKPVQSDYEKLIKEALILQASSDSLGWIVRDLKSQGQKENNYQKRQELAGNISVLEKEAKRVQNLANDKFSLAGHIKNPQNVPQPAVLAQEKEDIKVYTYPVEPKASPSNPNDNVKKDEAFSKGYQAATTAVVAELNNGFRILGASPYSKDNPIPLQSKLPEGLIYRIQLGAFSSSLEENAFRGLSPVTAEKTANSHVIKYYVGYFSSIGEARKALDDVKKYGYPDAFLVSYYKGDKISVQKARELEFAEK
jgi:hypothetical protein